MAKDFNMEGRNAEGLAMELFNVLCLRFKVALETISFSGYTKLRTQNFEQPHFKATIGNHSKAIA